MYNTEFKVKYNDIKTELIAKIDNRTLKNEDDGDYEYSKQDVLDICHKLYNDELTSVFYAENIVDDKIDIGMRFVLENMLFNETFRGFYNEFKMSDHIKKYVYDSEFTEEQLTILEQNTDLIIMLTLFNESLFYIFHKCVCQQLTNGTIDDELFEMLRSKIMQVTANEMEQT